MPSGLTQIWSSTGAFVMMIYDANEYGDGDDDDDGDEDDNDDDHDGDLKLTLHFTGSQRLLERNLRQFARLLLNWSDPS